MIRTGNERTGNRLLDIPVKGGEELTMWKAKPLS